MYTEEQVEQIKKELMNEKMMQFAQQINNTLSNNFVTAQKKNLFSSKFNLETVTKYLESPQKYEAQLRNLSIVLSTLSPQYNQIINYIPSICKFVPVIVPNMDKFTNTKGEVTDTTKIKKEYQKAVSYLDILNVQHEFQRITEICAREDIFYGYTHRTNDSFYIQQLDSDYCRVKYILEGCLFFEFDFSYFDKNNTLKDIEGTLVDSYPAEFQQKYKAYLNDKQNLKWQEIDPQNSICIKMLENLPFCFPPYANLYSDLSSLEDYKNMNKTKTETENYKFIGLTMPTSNKGEKVDDFLVDTTTAMAFYNLILSNLPDGVGAFISATPFEPVSFSNTNMSDKNQISQAQDDVYLDSGISPVAFGKGANTSTGLKTSNLIDSSKVYKLYRQFERWLRLEFKRAFNGKFTVNLLDVTTHTLEEEIKRQKELMAMGVPNKLVVAALLGLSQSNQLAMATMESVLDLQNTWLAPNSAYTTSGSKDEAGRPQSDNLTESGEATKDSGANIDK